MSEQLSEQLLRVLSRSFSATRKRFARKWRVLALLARKLRVCAFWTPAAHSNASTVANGHFHAHTPMPPS